MYGCWGPEDVDTIPSMYVGAGDLRMGYYTQHVRVGTHPEDVDIPSMYVGAGDLRMWTPYPAFFAEKSQERLGNFYVSSENIRKEPPVRPWRDRPPSSIYDPFAGMKTPGQRQLITLQEQVKLGIVNVDEAVLHFKEWQLNQKRRSESFRFQQPCPIVGPLTCIVLTTWPVDLEITVPIRHSQHLPGKVEFGVYESGPRKSVFPPRTELRRGDWKTDSTSSTASSASNRSSTRSLLSVSSGMEGDNEGVGVLYHSTVVEGNLWELISSFHFGIPRSQTRVIRVEGTFAI
ncbi:hypothetical protein STEG23_033295 [Scotinomys teguina]